MKTSLQWRGEDLNLRPSITERISTPLVLGRIHGHLTLYIGRKHPNTSRKLRVNRQQTVSDKKPLSSSSWSLISGGQPA